MPWPVYSERLCAAANVVGWTYAQVPVGRRAVIKVIVIDGGNASSGFVVVQTGAAVVYTSYLQAAKYTAAIPVMGVAYGGEWIGIYMSVLGLAASCAGYLFDDDSAATRPALEFAADPEAPPPADIARL